MDVRTIGVQCYEDDDLVYSQQQELERQHEQQMKPKHFMPMRPDLRNDELLPPCDIPTTDHDSDCQMRHSPAEDVSTFILTFLHRAHQHA